MTSVHFTFSGQEGVAATARTCAGKVCRHETSSNRKERDLDSFVSGAERCYFMFNTRVSDLRHALDRAKES